MAVNMEQELKDAQERAYRRLSQLRDAEDKIERLQSRIEMLLKLLGEKVGDACAWSRALSDAELQLVHEAVNAVAKDKDDG